MMTFTAPLPDHMASDLEGAGLERKGRARRPVRSVQMSGWTAKRFWTKATAQTDRGRLYRASGRPPGKDARPRRR